MATHCDISSCWDQTLLTDYIFYIPIKHLCIRNYLFLIHGQIIYCPLCLLFGCFALWKAIYLLLDEKPIRKQIFQKWILLVNRFKLSLFTQVENSQHLYQFDDKNRVSILALLSWNSDFNQYFSMAFCDLLNG